MAQSPLKKCAEPSCRQLIRGASRCEKHVKKDRGRSKASQDAHALYDWRWQQASKRYRAEHPLCVACAAQGRTAPTACTDHVVPHRGDLTLFWDESNWQSLCDACHRSKTARGQ